jgi:phosphatidylglycerol lysyltransferase
VKERLAAAAGPLLGLALFVLAAAILHHELSEYHYGDVVSHLSAIPGERALLALALTALNYLSLTGYDALSMRWIGSRLAYPRHALASFIAYVFSHNVGLSFFGGSAVRYRMFTSWGVAPGDLARAITFNVVTFWLGFLALGGAALALDPIRIPGDWHPILTTSRPLGLILLAVAAAYAASSLRRDRRVRVRGFEIELPGPGFTAAQFALSSLDWALAAAVLYALLPPVADLGFGRVLGSVLLSQLLGLASHVPAGLGVFETSMVLLLSPWLPGDQVLGSLLAYRLVYYVAPLAVALPLFVGHELLQRRGAVARVGGWVASFGPELVPRALAITTFAGGVLLLFSGAVPAAPGRMQVLDRLLPLPVIEASHLLASVMGGRVAPPRARHPAAGGRGVRAHPRAAGRRRGRLAGEGARLGRGCAARPDVPGARALPPLLPSPELAAVAVLLAGLDGGHRGRPRGHRRPRPARAPSRGVRPRALVAVRARGSRAAFPSRARGDRRAARRVRAGAAAASRPPADALARTRRARARGGIARESSRASAHLALLGDKQLLFDESGRGLLMYGVQRRSFVSMGDPVGPSESRRELAWRFRELADRHGGLTVFYEVGAEEIPLYLDLGLSLWKLGEEARVPLEGFTLAGGARKGLRQAQNRMQREGCAFEVVGREAVSPLLDELEAISNAWLARKNTREKRFSLGRFDRDYLVRTPLAVIRRGAQIVAFANVWAPDAKEEFSIDLMRQADGAPPGVMDALFAELILWGQAQGYRWFGLGMAPLSGFEHHRLAPRWNRLGALLFRHGEHFYNFQGLRAFKAKFDPVWEPRYLASPGGLATPFVLTDVAALISGGMTGVVAR